MGRNKYGQSRTNRRREAKGKQGRMKRDEQIFNSVRRIFEKKLEMDDVWRM
jgi:hypothetical protein